MAQTTYIGFSSIGAVTSRSVVKTGIDLVNIDLLNHFNTTPGENRMRPTFGCRIKQYLFDQYSDNDRALIEQEVMNVINAEPRVDFVSMQVSDVEYGISIAVVLNYNQFAVISTLIVNFNAASAAAYGFSGS